MSKLERGTYGADDAVNVGTTEDDICDDVYDLEKRVEVVVPQATTWLLRIAMGIHTLRTIPSDHPSPAMVIDVLLDPTG